MGQSEDTIKTSITLYALFLGATINLFNAAAETIGSFDFRTGMQGWEGNHHTSDFTHSDKGLSFRSTGVDPWLTSPQVTIPPGCRIRFTVRMATTAAGGGRLFWGARGFSEERACAMSLVTDGQERDSSTVLMAEAGQTRFRLDPCAAEGTVTIRSITIEALKQFTPPRLPAPERPRPGEMPALALRTGDIVLKHYQGRWGDWVVEIAGQEMAAGFSAEMVGIATGDSASFLPAEPTVRVERSENRLTESSWFTNADSRICRMHRIFVAKPDGSLGVTVRMDPVSGEFLHIPWLTLFPGLGTYGKEKTQSVVPGVEYLENEPSSSKADVVTADHDRRVADPHKLCFPFAAICHQDRYLAVSWEKSPYAAFVHDSPDRVFDSDAHLMALWGPGIGDFRMENDLFAHCPFPMDRQEPVTVRLTIHGGRGTSVIPAVEQYLHTHPLPALPSYPGGLTAAVDLMAAGWSRSDCYTGEGRWRHAVWQGFGAQPAADACALMLWLANHTESPESARNLRDLVKIGLDSARIADPTLSGAVSHVRSPVAPFVFGDVSAYLKNSRQKALNALNSFDGKGVHTYRARPDKPDYASTHFARHANGYSAPIVCQILESALITGDLALRESAIDLLDRQTELYANTVPRGAQTWELALHTPDILASAYMVKAYVLGFELTAREDLLDHARYWAWTGVPFIYLDRWTEGEIGDYATIPVLGATNWRAPLWIGRPVQWCGRVYAAMLERLARYDASGPWETLAKGITLSALQQTWPVSDKERQGLLPDFFFIETQQRDGPAINPGTVQTGLPFLYGLGAFFDSRSSLKPGWSVHAPCSICEFHATDTAIRFRTEGWGPQPYSVLVTGARERPHSIDAPPGAVVEHVEAEGWLIIRNVVGAGVFQVER